MHFDLGKHIIPVVNALPLSGVPNQLVRYMDTIYIWHPVYEEWNPLVGFATTVIRNPIAISASPGIDLFTWPVKANGVYEIEWRLLLSIGGTTGSPYITCKAPAGAMFAGANEGHYATTGTDNIYNVALDANTQTLTGVAPPANSPNIQYNGSGILQVAGTPGNFILNLIAPTNVLTVKAGSFATIRRIG